MWRLNFVIVIAFLAACAPRPVPPEPVPLPTAEAPEETYTYYWPVVFRSFDAMPTHTKRGVGLIYGISPDPNYTADSVTSAGGAWWHNWSMWPSRGQSVAQSGATFVPTLWGYGEPEFVALAEMCERGFTGPLMWLNEPDRKDQANKTPAQAVTILERILDTCPGVELVGPRLSHADWAHGFEWISAFWGQWIAKHGGLPPTVPAIHGYIEPSMWSKYLHDYRAVMTRYGWPKETTIWIPEWNVPCPPGRTPEQQAPLFDAVARTLDGSELVAYHSPFGLYLGRGYWPGLECAELRNDKGQLTPIGEIYRGYALAAYP